MTKLNVPRPTDAELSILRVLWQLGPSTVREVRETLDRVKPTGYTTVLKLLQIMTEKGLVRRDEWSADRLRNVDREDYDSLVAGEPSGLSTPDA